MDELAELRGSVNETARVARSNLLFLLVVGLYMGVLVANTDDLLLLKAGSITLPLMQVGVPVVMFYAVAPGFYMLLSFNLLLRLSRLTGIVRLLHERLADLSGEKRHLHSMLVFPFDFLQLLLCDEREHFSRVLLPIVVVISVVFIPLLLLLWIQVRFLAYQNEWITLAHQTVVTLNGVMLVLSGINIAAKLGTGRGAASRWAARRLSVPGIAAVSLAAVIFSWCIAVVPDSRIDRLIGWKTASTRVFKDWWHDEESGKDETPRYFRRYLHVRGKTVAQEEPSDEIIAAHIQQGDDEAKAEEKAWEHVDQLDLSGRSLRYGRFDSSRFKRVDLSNARLDNATLEEAELRKADLSGVDLRKAGLRGVDMSAAVVTGETKLDETGVNLRDAKLNGVDLSGRILQSVNLTDAELRGAKLAGTDLRKAKLRGVDLSEATITPYETKLDETDLNLRDAKLNGVNLAFRKLHNANLSRVELRGADLSGAELHGADLSRTVMDGSFLANAKLHGVDLSRAKLYGADLTNAQFHGANLSRAELYGADLTNAQFHGANLSQAELYGADLAYRGLKNVYLWRVHSEEPEGWSGIKNKIREGLRLRTKPSLTESDIEATLSSIEDSAATELGMSMPMYRRTGEDCIWHDRNGPFNNLPNPSINCPRSLVEFACKHKIDWVMKGIVEITPIPIRML